VVVTGPPPLLVSPQIIDPSFNVCVNVAVIV
jgi:hypothetical protein